VTPHVLMVVIIKATVFWNMTPSSPVELCKY
jgi:hypothetical protein